MAERPSVAPGQRPPGSQSAGNTLAGIAWRQQIIATGTAGSIDLNIGCGSGIAVQGTVVGMLVCRARCTVYLLADAGASVLVATGQATLRQLLWLLGIVKIYIDLYTSQHWLDIPTVPQAHLYGFLQRQPAGIGCTGGATPATKPPASNSKPK